MANELPKHLEWLRHQPCCECEDPPPCHPHHRPGGGKGRKTHDREAIPLCPDCHREFHSLSGRFKGWTRDRLRAWHQEMLDKQYGAPTLLDDGDSVEKWAQWEDVF